MLKIENISDMQVVLIGLSLVFLMLLLITVILYVIPILLGSRKKTEKPSEEVKVDEALPIPESASENNGALIAAITAAIMTYENGRLGSSKKSRIRVVSFKRVDNR